MTGFMLSWAKRGVGLTIHREDIHSDPRTNQNPLAVDMAGRMLTLAIDQRIGINNWITWR